MKYVCINNHNMLFVNIFHMTCFHLLILTYSIKNLEKIFSSNQYPGAIFVRHLKCMKIEVAVFIICCCMQITH